MDKSWHVYIIINDQGITYTGITFDTDVKRRIDQHNAGTGAKFTRGKGPWRLLYQENDFPGRGEAQSRERTIKADPVFKRRLKNAECHDHPLLKTER